MKTAFFAASIVPLIFLGAALPAPFPQGLGADVPRNTGAGVSISDGHSWHNRPNDGADKRSATIPFDDHHTAPLQDRGTRVTSYPASEYEGAGADDSGDPKLKGRGTRVTSYPASEDNGAGAGDPKLKKGRGTRVTSYPASEDTGADDGDPKLKGRGTRVTSYPASEYDVAGTDDAGDPKLKGRGTRVTSHPHSEHGGAGTHGGWKGQAA